jgi:phage-related protein
VALAPGVGQLAGQISGLLVPAINALAPVLASVAGWLSQNMGWIGPLAAAVVGLAGAYKVYSAAATAVGAVQAVIASKAVAAAAGWIANTAAIVANRVAMAANAAITGGAAVAAWVANTAAIVANRVATVAAQAVMLVVRGATMAWAAAQWVLNAALNANPLGIAIALIAALVAGIIYAWHNSETFRNVVLAVWAAIKTAIAAAVGWITGTAWPWIQRTWQAIQIATQILWGQIKSIWNGIKNAISTAVNAIRSVVVSVWNAIVNFVRAYINAYKAVVMAGFNAARAAVSSAMNAVRSVVSSIWSAIRSIISSAINQIKNSIAGIKIIINTIRNAFNNAKSAASAGISTIVSLVRGLPGKAAGALGNLGSLLYSKGKALVQGFINGIASMIGAVADKAQSVVHAVTKFLPGSPAEEGPLSGKGYVLLRARRFMNDFAQGLNDGSEKPASVLAGSVAGVARATVPSGSVTKSGASTAATTPAVAIGTRTYKVAIGDKEFAEIVVDAITGEPVAVSKASKEGDRRSAWSGSGR